MSDSAQPAWLKIMEHGAAGEARTKAFLLDRFWVLERSVDIDGADFLIQPRSLSERFTNRAPPKVGVVQAKYCQDRKTVHHVPCRYVLDDQGNPLKGFFVILHLGKEDAAAMYMLSASDIAVGLDRTADPSPAFILGTKALDTKYLVRDRAHALTRISHEISTRPAAESFLFLDRINIPYRKISEEDIDFNYSLAFPNGVCDIPKTYKKHRDQLRSIQYEIEEALGVIDNILTTSDPRKALAELAKLHEYRGGAYYRDSLTFGGHNLDLGWQDFSDALDEHDRLLSIFKAAGVLEKLAQLGEQSRKALAKKAAEFEGQAKNGQRLWAALLHDPTTLAFHGVDLRLLDIGDAEPAASTALVKNLDDFSVRNNIRLARAADDLWHGLISRVMEAACPDVVDSRE